MNEHEHGDEVQERLQAAIQAEVADDEGTVVGWVVVYETVAADADLSAAGHFYGPAGMTSWRALGLLHWAAQHTIGPEADE
jgi:hypothetical protein